MRPNGISQNRLARDLDVNPARVNDIVHGRSAITAPLALRLAKYFGTTPELWMNLQGSYELRRARVRACAGAIGPATVREFPGRFRRAGQRVVAVHQQRPRGPSRQTRGGYRAGVVWTAVTPGGWRSAPSGFRLNSATSRRPDCYPPPRATPTMNGLKSK